MSSGTTLDNVVAVLLEQLATARSLESDASPADILQNSLDQMRFLVGLEERLDVALDIGDELPFNLDDRPALIASVRELLINSGVAV